MKGFLSFMGIFAIIGILTLFGGAFFDMTTTGARCALGVSGTSNYTCDEFGHVAGSTVILPDRNVKLGVESIVRLRTLEPDIIEAMGPLYDTNEKGFRLQIIMGLIGIVVIIGLITFVCVKTTPGTQFDAGSYGLCILFAVVLFSFIHIAYTGIVEQKAEMPFTGVVTLLTNSDVLWDVVDDTALLPGTLTSDDILNEEYES